ncbi:phosphonate metabolism transcriptional regulator PhnF [Oceanimonas baumannii]|uniref:GntR family phosphonate transport system transcriptional regulator n=1 Tax=Oceanimonas baumannii TaxID=129578 RepID=A0A235CFF5_9GAMM|nr:phosphonate metabolism transcriptional regulator PhnF [Oceanimonas baumannii]MCC4265217.1 phosphonate metabolism transcriptional regulator PhnF [Oceanimonas baumannii]OYD23273.1 phosphonate metabolism transcriptional regulator PhnF [Oceanimonas baumannii]TDW58583.1 GntR family phosphonate transport system transcriptional regulator [Oceanimonas baumannii]
MKVYLTISRQLEMDIRDYFSPGDYLPPEARLAERFGVNRHTVRRAIDELVANGLVQRHQGKGNMVLRQPQQYRLHEGAHFTGCLLEQGSLPSSQVICSRLVTASDKLARELGIEPEQKIIQLQTLRHMEGIPRCVINHYLSDPQWWPAIKHFQQGSLHGFLKRALSVELKRESTRLGARAPSNEECRLLQINKSVPVMRIKTRNQLKGSNRIAEYSVSSARADLIEYVVEH